MGQLQKPGEHLMGTADWQVLHKHIIDDFLEFLNKNSADYVLKGGTALMECYGLDRMSEDVDLDSTNKENILSIIENYCAKNHFSYRVAKDTDTVKRYMINYGNNARPLKIEISYRNKEIGENDITERNGIIVYTIENLAVMKSNAYSSRDKIRDLYDVSFIVNNYIDSLPQIVKNTIADAVSYKGLEQFDYLLKTQNDDLIDTNQLAEQFLLMWDKLGIIDEEETRETSIPSVTDPTIPLDQIIGQAKSISIIPEKTPNDEYDLDI